MPWILAILTLSTLLLAGCGSSTKTGEDLASIVRAERARPTATTKCEVPAALIGKPHTDIAKAKLTVPVRVLFPGTPVTGDLVANRLNFKLDKKGIVRSITCG